MGQKKQQYDGDCSQVRVSEADTLCGLSVDKNTFNCKVGSDWIFITVLLSLEEVEFKLAFELLLFSSIWTSFQVFSRLLFSNQ